MMLWIALPFIAVVAALAAAYIALRRRATSRERYRGRRPRLKKPVCGPPLRGAEREKAETEIVDLWIALKNPTSEVVAELFNRRHANDGTTISFSYVRNVAKRYRAHIRRARGQMHQRRAGHVPWQLIWSLDLTFRRDSLGRIHKIFSIIEHYSRACLVLEDLERKTTIAMLRCVLTAIERFGTPRRIRTDNEASFRSPLFRGSLRFLGIKHELIDPGAGHQNARVERFFGTLKKHLRRWPQAMDNTAAEFPKFRFWYNWVRPHWSLFGRTPAEAWRGKDIFTEGRGEEVWFSAWDGTLSGPLFVGEPPNKVAETTNHRRHKPWSTEEEKILKKNRFRSLDELSELLPGRSKPAIRGHQTACKISTKGQGRPCEPTWTVSELDALRRLYPTASTAALRKAIPNHSKIAVNDKARRLGLSCSYGRSRPAEDMSLPNESVPDQIPIDMGHCYGLVAAQAFMAAAVDHLRPALTVTVQILGKYPVMTISGSGCSITAVIGRFGRASGNYSRQLRPEFRPMFRVNDSRVRVSSFTILGAAFGEMTLEQWDEALRMRVIPFLKSLSEAEHASEGASNEEARSPRSRGRYQITGEGFLRNDPTYLASRIRASIRNSRSYLEGEPS